MPIRSLALLTAAAIVAVGCVITTHHTIDAHVTVDIRHIEKQADDVLDFIEGEKDTLPPIKTPAPDKASNLLRSLDLAPIQVAYAAELKENSAEIREIAQRLRARNSQVEALKKQNLAGESNRGYVELRGTIADANTKNEVQRLVAEENADRKALYNAIAALNADANVTLSMVERVYAQKRLERARTGEIFQLPPSGEDFDKFKSSAVGKKLGADAQPNAWVTIK